LVAAAWLPAAVCFGGFLVAGWGVIEHGVWKLYVCSIRLRILSILHSK
jgi:hypothetical protein